MRDKRTPNDVCGEATERVDSKGLYGRYNFGLRCLVILEIFLKRNLGKYFTDCFRIS